MKLARLHKNASKEHYWHVQLAVIAAICLQVFLNQSLTIGPKYIIASFECLLILALLLFSSSGKSKLVRFRRSLAALVLGLISIANVASLVLVIKDLIGNGAVTGNELIISAIAIYITNIIVFGIWYWELDVDQSLALPASREVDFMFPQMSQVGANNVPADWSPTFFDYLYVSMTNASAFSPTDTMPLTHKAKLLMGLQSMVSLITIALVAARAVNILR